jgi:predicted transcriptional regulator
MRTDEMKRQIVEYLRGNPRQGFSQSLEDKRKLAKGLGDPSLNPQTLGWFLWRLWKEGLINSRKEGRKRVFFGK